MATTRDTLQIKIEVDGDGKVRAALDGASQGLQRVKVDAGEASGAFGKLEAAAAGAFAGFTVATVATWLVKTIAEAEQLERQLRAVTESQEEFNDANEIAQRVSRASANSVDSVTEAYITLRQRGLAPSLDTMRSFANLAAGTGKSIEDVASAVGAAIQGQTRGLREFGINVTTENGKLVGLFNGTKEVIGTTSADIIEYLVKIGNTKYAGEAAKEAQTLTGQWVQLQQAVEDLGESFGEAGLTKALTGVVNRLTALVNLTRELPAQLAQSRTSVAQLAGLMLMGPQAVVAAGVMAANDRASRPDFSNVVAGVNSQTQVLGANTEAKTRNQLATNALTDKEKEHAASLQGTIDGLRKQLVQLTAGEGAAMRYAGAQLAAKATSAKEREEILGLVEQLAQLADKRAADTKALREQTEAEKRHEDAVRDLNEQLAAEERRAKAVSDAYHSILDVIDPTGRELRALQATWSEMARAQDEARKMTTEQIEAQNAALDKLQQKIEQVAARGKLASALGNFTGDEEGAGQMLDRMAEDFAATLTKALKSGFRDAGSDFERVLENISDQIINDIIRNKLLKNLQTAAGGGQANWQEAGQAGATMIGVYGGSAIGGGGDRAQMGASIGSTIGGAIGSIWGPIAGMAGSLIGGLLGGAIGGMFEKEATAKIYNGPGDGGVYKTGISPFGRVNAYTYGLGDGAEEAFMQGVLQFDAVVAKLLNSREIAAVSTALEGYVSQGDSTAAALSDRLNVIIATVEPRWVQFLSRFEDIEQRVGAFASLRSIDAKLQDFDRIILAINGLPVEQLRQQMEQFDKQVADTAQTLADAIAEQDPVKIEQAAAASIQAVVDRYNAEIQLAQQLQDAIEQAQQAAYQLNLTIAQRIAAITGDNSQVGAIAYGRMIDLYGSIPGASPGSGLNQVSQYVGAVDQWLAAGTADINNWLNEQLGALQAQAAAQQAAAQAAYQAAMAAHQAQINALQQQLALAQDWVRLLDRAKAMQQSLEFGQTNPLGGYGQLDAMNSAINRLLGDGGIEGLNASNADQLLALLQQRLQLIQSQGLFQRASGDYLDQYNQTLAMIQQVQALAQPHADEALALQQQLADLQAQTVAAVDSGTSAIAAQEAELRREAKERLDKLNREAIEHYTWAQDQAQRLEDARTKELRDQLEELTGGLPVQDFIALKQHEATVLLTSIRDDLRRFLDAISNGGAGAGGNAGSGGGGGGGAGGGSTPVPTQPNGTSAIGAGDIQVNVTINAAEMTRDEVVRTFREEVRASASDIKRILDVA